MVSEHCRPFGGCVTGLLARLNVTLTVTYDRHGIGTGLNVTEDVTSERKGMRPLVTLAATQGGYLTTSQAQSAGVSRRMLAYYLKGGDLERDSYGIYRVRMLPRHPFGDVIAACLWAGPEIAGASMETALAVHGLSDAMPSKIHITVPDKFAGKRQGVVVHTASLAEQQRVLVDDVPVTSVARTLVDVSRRSRQLARQATEEALERGLVSGRALKRATGDDPAILEVLLGTDS